MAIPTLAAILVRGCQLLFAIIAFGLFVSLAKGQVTSNVPISTGFCATGSAYTLLAALIGLAAAWISRTSSSLALVIMDALAVVLALAGAVAYSAFLAGTNCSDPSSLMGNSLLNCGGLTYKGETVETCANEDNSGSVIMSRCNEAKAGDAFLYLACIASVGAVGMSYLAWRRGKAGPRY